MLGWLPTIFLPFWARLIKAGPLGPDVNQSDDPHDSFRLDEKFHVVRRLVYIRDGPVKIGSPEGKRRKALTATRPWPGVRIRKVSHGPAARGFGGREQQCCDRPPFRPCGPQPPWSSTRLGGGLASRTGLACRRECLLLGHRGHVFPDSLRCECVPIVRTPELVPVAFTVCAPWGHTPGGSRCPCLWAGRARRSSGPSTSGHGADCLTAPDHHFLGRLQRGPLRALDERRDEQ